MDMSERPVPATRTAENIPNLNLTRFFPIMGVQHICDRIPPPGINRIERKNNSWH